MTRGIQPRPRDSFLDMKIVVHHTKFYDWEPVPSDVKVTPADIAAGKVKEKRDGSFLMRVIKDATPNGPGSYTEIQVTESAIIAKIIHDKTRPEGGRELTRKQAVAFFLSENVLPAMAQRAWLTKFEVHDSGPHEELFREKLAPHIECGNIPSMDIEPHVAAYMEAATPDDHITHLHAHFKTKAPQ